jgi:DNA repair protein RecN (Recombination protein N)
VEKWVNKGQTLSTVIALGADERIEEIARMLAGDKVTEAARDAARALLV